MEPDNRVLGSKIKRDDWTYEQDMVFEHAMAEFEETVSLSLHFDLMGLMDQSCVIFALVSRWGPGGKGLEHTNGGGSANKTVVASLSEAGGRGGAFAGLRRSMINVCRGRWRESRCSC